MRLFLESIDISSCPGKVSLFVVVDAKGRFVAGTPDTSRGPSLLMEFSKYSPPHPSLIGIDIPFTFCFAICIRVGRQRRWSALAGRAIQPQITKRISSYKLKEPSSIGNARSCRRRGLNDLVINASSRPKVDFVTCCVDLGKFVDKIRRGTSILLGDVSCSSSASLCDTLNTCIVAPFL